MSKLLVIADDFTGALDTGVQFAKDGIASKVYFGEVSNLPDIEDGEVLIYNTNSRHMDAEGAYSIVRKAAEKAKDSGFGYVYKKTDSGLRGHIGAELKGAMEGFGKESLHFFPSYPKVRRITREGVHYIDGVKVSESVFGLDPFNPVKKDRVDEILKEESDLDTINHKRGESGKGKGIHIHDAESEEDFYSSVSNTPMEELAVTSGCAGFAPVLSKTINNKGNKKEWGYRGKRAIVVSGSINPVTQRIMTHAENNGLQRLVLVGRRKAERDYFSSGEGDDLIEKAIEVSNKEGIFIFDVGVKDEKGRETETYMREHGMDQDSLMESIADNLGELEKRILDKAEDTVLVSIGGDTLASTIKALGIQEITPIAEPYPGVVLTEIMYKGKKVSLITKSGGFGDEDLLEKLLKDISK